MNTEHEDHDLTTALRERMTDVRPDLDRLVTVATRQGARIRRRTQLASFGGAAGVAAVAVALGTSWAGGSSGAHEQRLGFADEPSTPVSSAPATASPSSATTRASGAAAPSHPPGGEGAGHAGPARVDLRPGGRREVRLQLRGSSVQVTWRPADERPYWGNNPDKSADFISDVHGKNFVTVVASPGTPSSAAVAVGQALDWTPRAD